MYLYFDFENIEDVKIGPKQIPILEKIQVYLLTIVILMVIAPTKYRFVVSVIKKYTSNTAD